MRREAGWNLSALAGSRSRCGVKVRRLDPTERQASLERGRGQTHGQKEGEPVVLSLLSANSSSFPGRGRQEHSPAQLPI